MFHASPQPGTLQASCDEQVVCTTLPLSEIEGDPELFGLAREYWDRIRGGRWAPARGDFNPSDIAHILPHVLLMEVCGSKPRFRYRLAGTRTADIHGVELTGRYVDELRPTEFAQLLTEQLMAVVRDRSCQLVHWSFVNGADQYRDYRVLRMPLSSDGENVDLILTVADYLRIRKPLGLLSVSRL